MLKLFHTRWDEAPITVLDVETTGKRPGHDRVVQIGLARFEGGVCVDTNSSEINPGMPIPAEATAIHGITDEMVRDAPTLEGFFGAAGTKRMLEGAQLCAYNFRFDQLFVLAYIEDFHYPWLEPLVFVRHVDRFTRGVGRHRLEVACERHGIQLAKAHDAGSDARAAGELLFKLVRELFREPLTIGELLRWQRERENEEWWRFCGWLAAQPPREGVGT